jgi:hypothetical protein
MESNDGWTDAEVCKLLEISSHYPDDMSEVARQMMASARDISNENMYPITAQWCQKTLNTLYDSVGDKYGDSREEKHAYLLNCYKQAAAIEEECIQILDQMTNPDNFVPMYRKIKEKPRDQRKQYLQTVLTILRDSEPSACVEILTKRVKWMGQANILEALDSVTSWEHFQRLMQLQEDYGEAETDDEDTDDTLPSSSGSGETSSVLTEVEQNAEEIDKEQEVTICRRI